MGAEPSVGIYNRWRADSYEACDALREDAIVAILKEDEETLEEINARAIALEDDFQPHFDAMGLSIGLQLPNPVQEALGGGGLLTLDTCSMQSCSLTCEGLVQVQKVEEETADGQFEVQTWTRPSQLLGIQTEVDQSPFCIGNRSCVSDIHSPRVSSGLENIR